MADTKTSALPAAAPLTGAEALPGVQGGASVKITAQAIAELGSEIVEITVSETLAMGRAGKFLSANHASAGITVTVPPASSVAFAVGTEIHVRQTGVAAVTIAQGASVTINQPATQTKVLSGQYSVVTLKKMATDTWALFGGLAAA